MNSRAALKQFIALCLKLVGCYKTISLTVWNLRYEVTLKALTVQKTLLTTLQRNVFGKEQNQTQNRSVG